MASQTYTNVSPSYNNFQLVLTLSSTANISTNKSTVTYDLYLKVVNATSNYRYSYGNSASFTLNGTTIISTDNVGSIQCNNTPVGTRVATLASGSMEVAHNADGTKSIAYSASFRQTQSWGTAAAVSGNFTLDTIARTSKVSVSSVTVTAGSAVTVYTNRNSTSFTHTLQYKIGNGSYTTFGTSIENSLSWTVPTSIANSAPSGNSVSVTINCITYNGSTQIGTSTCSLTVNVPSYTPTISSISLSDPNNKLSGYYIQGLSKLTVTINSPSTSYGASISSYSITVTPPSGSALRYSTSSATTGLLDKTGTWSVSCTVTDSRGKTSAAKTGSITVTAYTTPSITGVSLTRTNTSGTEQYDGNSMKLAFTWSCASVSSKNTCTVKWQYRAAGGSYNTATQVSTSLTGSYNAVIVSGSLSADSSYNVLITVADKFTTVTYQVDLSSARIPIDVYPGGAGLGLMSSAGWDRIVMGAVMLNDEGWFTRGDRNRVHPLPKVHYSELPSQSIDTQTYFKELIYWLCQNYPNQIHSSWFGVAHPNSVGLTAITIYDTTAANLDSSTHLPRYCSGMYIPLAGSEIAIFGTDSYSWYWRRFSANDRLDYGAYENLSLTANQWVCSNINYTVSPNMWYAAHAHVTYNQSRPNKVALMYTQPDSGNTYNNALAVSALSEYYEGQTIQYNNVSAVFYPTQRWKIWVFVNGAQTGIDQLYLKVRLL